MNSGLWRLMRAGLGVLALLAACLASGGARASAAAPDATAASTERETLTVRAARVENRAPVFERLAPIAPVRLQAAAGMEGYAGLEPVAAVGIEGLPAIEALAAAAGRLAVVAGTSYSRLEGTSSVALQAPVIEPISAGLAAVVAVAPGYAPLDWVDEVENDPFLAPLELWRHGPLGMLRTEALAAAARADWFRFNALHNRFWELYTVAEARRAALGDGRRQR